MLYRNSILSIAVIFITFLVFSIDLYSQSDKSDLVIESLVEEIASNSDENLDYSEIFEELMYYKNNPLNLNEATRENLEKLYFLSDLQIDGLLNYRKQYGDIKTIYELQLMDNFDTETINKLLSFVTVSASAQVKKIYAKNVFKYGHHQIFLRTQTYLQEMKGYNIADSLVAKDPNKTRYLGSPMKYYLKYKFYYKDQVQFGITAEKDPGEQFFAGTQKNGFDFYSAHVQLNDIWKFKTIVLGDFQAQFGQGLALWTGMTMGKSTYVLNVRKNARGLRKYSSTDENKFMRGIGATMKFGDFSFSAFGSYHKIDGNIPDADSLDDADIREITSFQITGYHRTPAENIDRKKIGQTIFGANVSYSHNNFKTGLTFVNYNFSASLNKTIKPYQLYEFQGNTNSNLGWNYDYSLRKFYFFGETAISQNRSLATLNGLIVSLSQQISLVTLYRNYSPGYQAYFSAAFAEGSHSFNEKGLYLGLEVYPIKNFKISSYIDSYSFPWLKSRLNAPMTDGLEYLTQIDFSLNRNVSMYLKFKHEIKPENTSQDVALKYPTDKTTWSVRYHISYRINKFFSLKNRIELSGYKKDAQQKNGFMAYQDIKFTAGRIPLSVYFRYAIFDAPYDARIYAYENDVLYAFSVPGYFYKGFRTYLVFKYDITNQLTAWLKYSQFTFSDRDVISENSLQEINGNTKSEIKLQFRYKF